MCEKQSKSQPRAHLVVGRGEAVLQVGAKLQVAGLGLGLRRRALGLLAAAFLHDHVEPRLPARVFWEKMVLF